MKYYETLYIAHPILEMGRLQDLVQEVEKFLDKRECELLCTNVWGKKRLSYPISKQKFGTYVMIQYKTDSNKNNEITFDMDHNPNILRHMTVLIDEAEIKEQTEDVWDQISGLSKPHKKDEEKSDSDEEKDDSSNSGDNDGIKLADAIEDASTEKSDEQSEEAEQETSSDDDSGSDEVSAEQTEPEASAEEGESSEETKEESE